MTNWQPGDPLYVEELAYTSEEFERLMAHLDELYRWLT
jgi:hypothetical protein